MARRRMMKLAGATALSCGFTAALIACGSATQVPPAATFDAGSDATTDATVPPFQTDGSTNTPDAPVTYPDGSSITPQADAGSKCDAESCTTLGFNCGFAINNCGTVINCNAGGGDAAVCPTDEVCGANAPNQCGLPASVFSPDGAILCTPTTNCSSLGYNCGYAQDNCGNPLNCGGSSACDAGTFCGGGGYNICGTDGGFGCMGDAGLCHEVPACDAGVTTTLTGSVHAPLPYYLDAGAAVGDPVPNVVVYIAQAALDPFPDSGVTCNICGADISGDPLGTPVKTGYDGTFTLTGVPVGVALNVVIQLGHWRRSFPIASTVASACATTSLGILTMPRDKTEGDIPLTAISTGSVDGLECVLRKMGVSDSEFTTSSGTGRIQIFSSPSDYTFSTTVEANAGAGASLPGALSEEALTGADGGPSMLMSYDQVLFPCWGTPATKTTSSLNNLVEYADNGGHFFATHYSYTWMATNGEFANAANWAPGTDSNMTTTVGNVEVASNPEGTVFSEWLNLVGALSNGTDGGAVPATPQISIANPRHDVNSIKDGSVDWIDGTDPNKAAMVLHFTTNTPIVPAAGATQCGHVIFSDFHVANTSTSPDASFPTECPTTPLTPQEKVLEYMIWDLASCIPNPAPPTCEPTSCTALGFQCGPAGDGCGNLIDGGCGDCPPGQFCGGPAGLGQCYTPDAGCTPKACPTGWQCGSAADGCGNILNCGTCPTGEVCGLNGPGTCGTPGNK